MSFMEAVKTCFRKYVDFNGRARRSEYWYFCLFNVAVNLVIDIIFGSDSALIKIYSVAVLLPGIAVAVRRLHDIGKSGWSYLFILIPLVGWIMVIVWFCKAGDEGRNAYGEDPKGIYADAQTASYTPVDETPAEPAAAPAEEPAESYTVEDDPFSKENIQANYGPKFCSACGAELKPGQKFCEYCGTKV